MMKFFSNKPLKWFPFFYPVRFCSGLIPNRMGKTFFNITVLTVFNRKFYFVTRLLVLSLSTLLLFNSCSESQNKNSTNLEATMNSVAENYVRLVLNIGIIDPDYVDAYYGPAEWKPEAKPNASNDSAFIQNLYDDAGKLLDSLESLSNEQANELQTLRYRFLYKQILASRTKAFMLAGGKLSFDEEAKALYDAEVPTYDSSYFQNIIEEINNLLPGEGNVSERWQNYKKQFIIPNEKLDAVFQAAINECRKRTLQYIKLPAKESFKVEYVNGKPWGGYNWFKGNSFSLIQVNTDLPSYIERAVNLAAHEGYPGHHVLHVCMERLYRERNWVEFCVYPLFGPQALISEGTANYGKEIAFPGDSQMEFEKEVLFPLAGLAQAKADNYYKITRLLNQLSYSRIEAARNYLDDKWTKEQTIEYLQKYNLDSKERAEQRLKFFEKYRSYIINYNLGYDIVKQYIEKNGETSENEKLRWALFEKIISTPQTPSGLK